MDVHPHVIKFGYNTLVGYVEGERWLRRYYLI